MSKLIKKKSFWIIIGVLIIGLYMAWTVLGGAEGIKAKLNPPERIDGEDGIYLEEAMTVSTINEKDLEEGCYYILHKDQFYPLLTDFATGSEPDDMSTNNQRIYTITADQMYDMTTLYLGQGDKLVYYNPTTRLETEKFERLTDVGCSLGFYGIKPDYAGLYTIPLYDDKNVSPFVAQNSSAASLLEDFPDPYTTLTIGQIGGQEINPDLVTNAGIILGLEENRRYDTDIYNGTVYNYKILDADTHYFSGMELYKEALVPLVENIYQVVDIPEHLPDGYYIINDTGGLFRLVRGDHYTVDSDFNTRQLEIKHEYLNGTIQPTLNETVQCYSTIPDFNYYKPEFPGSFGYEAEEDETETELIETDSDKIEDDSIQVDEAIENTIPVYLKKGVEYTLTVTAEENTGEVRMAEGDTGNARQNKTNTVYFEKEEQEDGTCLYTLTLTGNDNFNEVIIHGFTKDYTYDFNGADQNLPERETEEEEESVDEEETTVTDAPVDPMAETADEPVAVTLDITTAPAEEVPQ